MPVRPDVGLVVDIQATQSPSGSLVARYVEAFTLALLRETDRVRALLLNPLRPFPVGLHEELLGDDRLRWATATTYRSLGDPAHNAYVVTAPFVEAPADSAVPPFALDSAAALAVVVHDLPVASVSDAGGRRHRSRLDVVRGADVVLATCDTVRDRIVTEIGVESARVATIGVAPWCPSANRGRLPRGVRRPFILGVGEPSDARLAQAAFAAVSPAVRKGVELAVLGAQLTIFSLEAGGRERVIELDGADEFDGLIAGSSAVVALSSNTESVLLAAAAAGAGKPLVAPREGPAAEWLGGASLFDAGDAESLSGAIFDALRQPEPSESRRGEPTWEGIASKTVDTIAGVRRKASPPPGRRRIALVGPLPPVASGIAIYNALVLRELCIRADVDVFVTPGSGAPDFGRGEPTGCFPIRSLERAFDPFAYDAVIYTLGNSSHHHDTLELAKRCPGVLWLHDVRLAGLYLTYAVERLGADRAEEWMLRKLHAQYGPRLAPGMVEEGWTYEPEHVRFGTGMLGELVDRSRGVIVNSGLAERMVALDGGPDAGGPPVWVVPHAFPAAPVDASPQDPPLVLALGIATPAKAPDLVIDAFAVVRRSVRCKLAFVGLMSDAERDQLGGVAERRGVAPDIEFAGAVDDDEYWHWIARASCAVQLRRGTHGESSGTVHDCIAAGVPVVTNVLSARELDPRVIQWVSTDVREHDLAARIEVLLTNGRDRQAQIDAGLGAARSWTYADVADRVVDIVGELVPR